MQPTKVLIVDDSPTMRRVLRLRIEAHPKLQVVGEAGDAFEARELIKQLSPDVLTLDIEMPKMSGLEFLKRLMKLRPMPVIMVSSIAQASTTAAITAMQLGAVDCVAKPTSLDDQGAFDKLPELLLTAAQVRTRDNAPHTATSCVDAAYNPGRKIQLIGSSTGGVESLFTVLQRFPKNCPPTLITQHIPAHFSKSFAQRLNSHCAPTVCEAEDGLKLSSGMVVIAPGGETHLELSHGMTCHLTRGDRVSGHRPSVDQLFRSALPFAKRIAAVLMTGMGRDGADGLKELRDAGAYTMAQDEESSVVFGMPRAAIEVGAAIKVCPLDGIAKALLEAPIGADLRAADQHRRSA